MSPECIPVDPGSPLFRIQNNHMTMQKLEVWRAGEGLRYISDHTKKSEDSIKVSDLIIYHHFIKSKLCRCNMWMPIINGGIRVF